MDRAPFDNPAELGAWLFDKTHESYRIGRESAFTDILILVEEDMHNEKVPEKLGALVSIRKKIEKLRGVG